MDVIDQLLADLRHEACVFYRLEASEPWRIQKAMSPVAPFYAVLSGSARVVVGEAVHELHEGDFIVLPGGSANELTGIHSAEASPVPLISLLEGTGVAPWRPGIRYRRTAHLRYGGRGEQSVVLGGIFSFRDLRKNPLLCALPPALVLRANDPSSPSATIIDAIRTELACEQPGSNLMIAKFTDLLFLQTLRAYLATDLENTTGWIRGMMDPMVGRAISRLHAAPERRWTLQELAQEAGSSRSVFAQRFSALVGQGALTYLTGWRMHVAAGLLLDEAESIATVAGRVGYQSEAAFSIAFKRWAGSPPSQYRSEKRRILRQAQSEPLPAA